MPERSKFSPNAILRGEDGIVYEQLNNEGLPKQPMSKDEEVLALLGYKQGSKPV